MAATLACGLLRWLRLLCLDGPLAKAALKTLRYRLPHAAARIVAANAGTKSASPRPGSGPHNWLPACSPPSPYPGPTPTNPE